MVLRESRGFLHHTLAVSHQRSTKHCGKAWGRIVGAVLAQRWSRLWSGQPARAAQSRCWRGRAWGVLGAFRVTVTIHKSWGRGQGGRGRDTPEFGVEWGVLYGQLHDAAALRRRACQNLQVFQVKPRKPKGAPRQRVRFARCACVTVTIIIPMGSQWNKVPLTIALKIKFTQSIPIVNAILCERRWAGHKSRAETTPLRPRRER